MPTYSFRNRETGEVFDEIMRIAAKEQYLIDNPQLESIITSAPALGDPTKLTSSRKFDSGFKEVLQKIHERSPGSELNKTSSQL
jgi:hypothetical protein